MSSTKRTSTARKYTVSQPHKFAVSALLALFVLSATQINAVFAAVVPLNKTQFSSKGFGLSGTFSNVGNVQSGAGAFANGSIKNYPEGSCIPALITVKNNDNAAGDIIVSPVYDYLNGTVGIANLQTLTTSLTGSQIASADNLNDFAVTGNALSVATSFTTIANGSVSAVVTGPFSGNDAGTVAVTASDATRHYNITLANVAAGATVNLLFCGRLGVDANQYTGASLSIRTVQGGQENIAIMANQLLLLPSLTIQKVVSSGSALPEDFSFTVSPAINGQSNYSIATGQNSVFIDNIMPDGAYSVTESGPNGYSFASGTGTSCSFSQSGTASATVASGKPATNATCIFTNEEVHVPMATITVTKVVENDNTFSPGTKVVSDFPLFVGNTGVTSGAATQITPGTYTVSETNQAGYTATYSGDCAANGSITLADGDNKTCTITNNDTHVPNAKLTVTKVVVNDNSYLPGTKVVSDFPLFVGNTGVTSGASNDFAPGTYTVTESGQGGYTATYSGDCATDGSITLADGDNKSCTITNNDVYVAPPPPEEVPNATLTVTKVVQNDNTFSPGTKVVSDFPLYVGATLVSSGAANAFAPGTYTVTESGQGGYTATYSGDCAADGSITLASGDNKSCTITNNDIHVPNAKLTVTKVVVNDNQYLPGTAVVSDFPLFIGTNGVTSGASNDLTPGAYTISETGSNAYTAAISGDCAADGSITLVDGDNKSCTITNNDVYVAPPPEEEYVPSARLTVTKVVVNDNTGTKVVADFPLYVGATLVTSGQSNTFSPAAYVVSETGSTGYTAVISGDCATDGSITLADGDVKSCTITNNDIYVAPPEEPPAPPSGGGGGSTPNPTITVVTVVINDDGGSLLPSGVLTTVGDGTSTSSTFGGSTAPGMTVSLPSGSYVVDSALVTGYSRNASTTCTGSIALGQNVVCTITYDDVAPAAPAPTPIVLGVTDSAPVAPPAPVVLGVTDSAPVLPRTGGAPVAFLPLLAAGAALLAAGRRQRR